LLLLFLKGFIPDEALDGLSRVTYFFGVLLDGGVISFMRRYSTICPYSSEACTAMYAACVQWRRPSRRHCLLYRIKCALVCESFKTVLDVSTLLDGPSLRVVTILHRPEVQRRS
jgi:hypothetical protein